MNYVPRTGSFITMRQRESGRPPTSLFVARLQFVRSSSTLVDSGLGQAARGREPTRAQLVSCLSPQLSRGPSQPACASFHTHLLEWRATVRLQTATCGDIGTIVNRRPSCSSCSIRAERWDATGWVATPRPTPFQRQQHHRSSTMPFPHLIEIAAEPEHQVARQKHQDGKQRADPTNAQWCLCIPVDEISLEEIWAFSSSRSSF